MYFILLLAAMPLAGSAQVRGSASEIDPMPAADPNGSYSNIAPFGKSNGRGTGSGATSPRSHGNPRLDGINTIPVWKGNFSYQRLNYDYWMVGADPKRGSSTTVVPSVIVPLRFVFADGSVFDASTDLIDGQTSVNGILNSPIFQPYDFVIGGTNVGTTQYGDAFQRANFWGDVSKGSHDYHVLLGGPNVIPLQTINVPTGKFGYITDPATHQIFPVVEDGFVDENVRSLIQNLRLSPQSLPIFVTGSVSPFNSWGYHSLAFSGNAAQTYIVTTYQPHNVEYYGQHVPDIYVLSHEITEWMDDPFTGNLSPGWNFVDFPQQQCVDNPLLEVGDPFAFLDASVVAVSNSFFTYHVTDAAFVDFFTRSPASRSVNGQYSLFATSNGPTPPCVGHVQVAYTFFAFPGATRTEGLGINNSGQIVGDYRDISRRTHGFLLDRGNFTSIHFPGSIYTTARKINDSGLVVGYFFDSSRLPHGFSFLNGSYARIDFPGSIDTVVGGINSAGDIVGGYDDQNFNTHQFLLHNGRFQQFDSPLAGQSQASAINDSGLIAGIAWDDSILGPFNGFVKDKNVFSSFTIGGSHDTYPFSINNAGDLSGIFFDSNGYSNGFVTIYGYPYQVYGFAFGNNDKSQIVGSYNFGGGRIFGYVADLPK